MTLSRLNRLFEIMALTLFGTPLPPHKRVLYALPLVYGIGFSLSRQICRSLGFPPTLSIDQLTPAHERALAKVLKSDYTVAGHLQEEEKADIHRLTTNGSQRGYRLRTGLPVRGQRTHTNAKTARRLRSRFK